MENSEYETILNYMARGEYPAGTTKEQKRAIRRKVAARSTNTNNTNSVKFVAKDSMLYFVNSRRDGLGLRERRVVRTEEKMQYFEIVMKLRLVCRAFLSEWHDE